MAVRYYNSSRVRNPKAVAIMAGIAGLLILALAFFLDRAEADFARNAVTLQGKVVQMKIDRSGGAPLYQPMFEFTTPAGKVTRAPAQDISADYGYGKGEVVEILFNPEKPASVRVAAAQGVATKGMYFTGLFLLGVSVLAMLVLGLKSGAYPAPARVSEDSVESHIYISEQGRIRFLRHPKKAAIVLAVIGLLMLTAGIYASTSGADFGQENQNAAFFGGALVFLALAAYTWRIHRRTRKARTGAGD